ncbi:MAG: hypothetical protein Q9226_006009 [Calogaya cf. arnoldii]
MASMASAAPLAIDQASEAALGFHPSRKLEKRAPVEAVEAVEAVDATDNLEVPDNYYGNNYYKKKYASGK